MSFTESYRIIVTSDGIGNVEVKLEKLSNTAKNVSKSVNSMEGSISSMGKSVERSSVLVRSANNTFSSLNSTFTLLKAYILSLPFSFLIKSFSDIERSVSELNNELKNTGDIAGYNSEQLINMSYAFQKSSTFGQKSILDVQTTLLGFTNIRGEVFEKTTQSVLDLATVMHTSIPQAAKIVGEALNQPITGLASLSQYGVRFTKTQKDMIDQLVASGDVMKAQGVILDQLSGQFGGAATASVNTLSGSFSQFINQLKTTSYNILEVKQSLDDLNKSDGIATGFIKGATEGLKTGERDFKSGISTIEKDFDDFRDRIKINSLNHTIFVAQKELSDYKQGKINLSENDVEYFNKQISDSNKLLDQLQKLNVQRQKNFNQVIYQYKEVYALEKTGKPIPNFLDQTKIFSPINDPRQEETVIPFRAPQDNSNTVIPFRSVQQDYDVQGVYDNNAALLEQTKKDMQSLDATVNSSFASAFGSIITGTSSVRDAFKNMFSSIAESAAEMFASRAMQQFIGGWGESKTGAGDGGFFSGLFSLFGSSSKLPGHATGSDFIVGGQGGADNNVVAFRASRGEQVTVKTPAQQRSSSNNSSNNVVVNLALHMNSNATNSREDANLILSEVSKVLPSMIKESISNETRSGRVLYGR